MNIIEFQGKFEPAFRIVESQMESNELEKPKTEMVNILSPIIRRNSISTFLLINGLVAGLVGKPHPGV